MDLPGTGHNLDLMDQGAALKLLRELRPSHLLQFAWETKLGEFWESARNLDWVGASLHLSKCFAECGGRRFIGAGTCAEYQWDETPCDEQSTPLVPATFYGTCKNAARAILQAYFRNMGVEFAWGRIFWAYGPGEKCDRFVPSILRPLLAGKPARCRQPLQRRDLMHVADVGEAFSQVLLSDLQGAVNICSGTQQRLGEVAEFMADHLGRRDLLQLADTPEPARPLRLAGSNRRLLETGYHAPPAWRTRMAAFIDSAARSPAKSD